MPGLTTKRAQECVVSRALVVVEVDAKSAWPQFQSQAALEVVWE